MRAHYDTLGDHYESAWFYQTGSRYQAWLADRVIACLRLQPAHRLADLGCGTGSFSARLARSAGLQQPVVAVDRCEALLAAAHERPALQVCSQDIASFAAQRGARFDGLLLKEVVHHLPEAGLVKIFTGLAGRLKQTGRLLCVTRPQQIDYPFFEAALRLWPQLQPAPATLSAALEAAGLRVELEEASYPAEVETARWLQMLRDRFWSTFAHFDDAALERGVAELERRFAGQERLRFEDRLIFLCAGHPRV